jgi:hypothetical protein
VSKGRQQFPVLLLTLIWGFLLSGSFIYLPDQLSAADSDPTASIVVSLSWLTFTLVFVLVGFSYERLRAASRLRSTLLAASVLPVLALMLMLTVAAPLAQLATWFLLVPVASLLSAVITFQISSRPAGATLARASAAIGATPILGSTIFSLLFAFTEISTVFLLAFLATLLLALVSEWVTARSGPPKTAAEKPGFPRSYFFFYGLLISLAIALANAHLYLRVSELELGPLNDPLVLTGQIILAAGILGALGSAVSALPAAVNAPEPMLLRASALLVAVGAIAALLVEQPYALLLAASVAAFGFGLANGLEIRVLAKLAPEQANRPKAIAIYTALTTTPYAVGGGIGALLLGLNQGTAGIFATASLSALMALLLVRPMTTR